MIRAQEIFDFLVVFVGSLLFSIVNVLASLTNEIKTILAYPFINVPVDELNKLNNKHVRVIIIDDIGDDIPESEDNSNENYKA